MKVRITNKSTGEIAEYNLDAPEIVGVIVNHKWKDKEYAGWDNYYTRSSGVESDFIAEILPDETPGLTVSQHLTRLKELLG